MHSDRYVLPYRKEGSTDTGSALGEFERGYEGGHPSGVTIHPDIIGDTTSASRRIKLKVEIWSSEAASPSIESDEPEMLEIDSVVDIT